jgi:hypothetical protein
MSSPTFDVFLQAAKDRRQIVCNYQGRHREACPHVIGWGKDGSEMALVFQFAGDSSKGLPPGGEWRCLRLAEVANVVAQDGAWHTGLSHLRPQTCVKRVEFEVMV